MGYLRSYRTKKGIKYTIREGTKDIANLGYCTRREAEKSLKQVSQEIARQKLSRKFHLRDDKLLLTNYLDDYREKYLCRKAPKTIEAEERAFVHFLAFFNGLPLAEIQKGNIEGFINYRLKANKKDGDPFSPNTIHQELRILRRVFNCALEDELIDSSPFKRSIKFPKGDKKIPRYLTQEEMERFLEVSSFHIRSIVLMGALTGLRTGELLRLKFGDVDFKQKYLKVVSERERHTKTRAGRIVELNETALEELNFLKGNWPHTSKNLYSVRQPCQMEYVFCNKEGRPYNKLRRSFDTARKKAGLADVKPHDLRKTFVSWLAQKGHHPEVARRLAGHSEIRITMDVYTDITREQLRNAVEDLPKFRSNRKRIVKALDKTKTKSRHNSAIN